MGKKRHGGFKTPKNKGINQYKNAVDSDDSNDDGLEDHLESILDDEIDTFNKLKEKGSKKNNTKRKISKNEENMEEEEEIYNLNTSSEDEDEKIDDLNDEDDESSSSENNTNNIPDARAWGHRSSSYFNTDYIDPDFDNDNIGSDMEMAEMEELEAKELQLKIMNEINENDFMNNLTKNIGTKIGKNTTKEMIKIDFNELSLAEKKKLIKKECPEIEYFLNELKDNFNELKQLKTNKSELNEIKYHILLNYSINIIYYLHIKSNGNYKNLKIHPVLKKILQFKKLYNEINSSESSNLHDKKIHQIESIESNLLNKLKEKEIVTTEEIEIDDSKELEKRNITYEMKKNKGLTPHRKKEQRNPRVKHRNKFRKAIIRRKGQIRNVRSEVKKYDGESYGIKTNILKGRKIH